jgi:hypothetical protein
MVELKDKQLRCKICGHRFTFTIGEQRFYRDRGLAEPRRCPTCRRVKREELRNEHTED